MNLTGLLKAALIDASSAKALSSAAASLDTVCMAIPFLKKVMDVYEHHFGPADRLELSALELRLESMAQRFREVAALASTPTPAPKWNP